MAITILSFPFQKPGALQCIETDRRLGWIGSGPCPTKVGVFSYAMPSGYCANVGVRFNGGAMIDAKGKCGGSDPYVTVQSGTSSDGGLCRVDVWKAFHDGVWTSSVEIEVGYVLSNPAAFFPFVPLINPFGSSTPKFTPEESTTCECPTVVHYTITVGQTGIVTVA